MKHSRRRLLSASTAAAVTAAAGCVGLLDGDEANDGGEGENETDGRTDAGSSSGANIPIDDWPSFQRSPRNDGYTPGTAPTDDPAERWSTTLPGAVTEQVAVVDGTVYAATDAGTVHALDAVSGDEQWTEPLEGGRSQCPCVVDGLVVVGTAAGELVALDATDGEREWATELAGPVAGPTAADGTIYVGTSEAPTAYAIDAADGDELWSTELAVDVLDYPAITGDGVYVAAEEPWDGRLHGLDRSDGTERWTREQTRMGTPTIFGDDIVSLSRTPALLSPAGEQRSGFGIVGDVFTSPAATTETLVVGTGDGDVKAIAREDFDRVWTTPVSQYPISASAVTDGAAYVTTNEPELLALDLESGDRTWDRLLEGGSVTAPTIADGAVFVGTDAGQVVAFD